MIGSSDQDDPLDWPIDRVVDELCHKQLPNWMVGSNLKPFNDPAALETALRDNDMDGDALLNLEESNIRADLGVASFGQRHRLRQIIAVLRRQSEKYEPTNIPVDLKPQLSHTTYHSRGSFSSYDRPRSAKTKSPTTEFPTRSSHTPLPRTEKQIHDVSSYPVSKELRSRPTTQDEKKEVGLLNELESHLDGELWLGPGIETSVSQQDAAPDKGYVKSGMAKRRRIAPENISSQPLTVIGMEKGVNSVPKSSYNNDEPKPAQHRALPLQPHKVSAALEDYAQQNYAPKPRRMISASKKLLNAKIGATQASLLDVDTALDTNFTWENLNSHPKIQRFAFKHAGRHTVEGDAETSVAMKTRKTIHSLEKESDSVEPAKTSLLNVSNNNLSAKTSLNPDYGPGARSELSATTHAVDTGTLEDGYKRLLEQYPPIEDDVVLPLYGDSDEDERYATDGSISDADEGVDMSLTGQSTLLSKAEIDAVIDETIREFKADWVARKFPKIQRTAHDKWMLAFNVPQTRNNMLKAARIDLESASRRLPIYRSALHDSTWTKICDIKQMCDSLSATIELIEVSKFFIQVLESEREPIRPSPKSLKQPRVRRSAVSGEDNCSSEEDSIDDFVADDEVRDHVMTNDSIENNWNPQLATSQRHISISGAVEKDPQPPGSARENVMNGVIQGNNVINIIDIEGDEVMTSDNYSVSTDQAEQGVMEDIEFDLPRTPVRKSGQAGNQTDAGDEAGPISSSERTKSAKKRTLNDSKKRNPMALPDLTDSSDNTSDTDSDFDRGSRVPRTEYKKQGSTLQPIDLTFSSPAAHPPNYSEFEIRTPELNAVDAQEQGIKRRGKNTDEPEEMSLEPSELPDIETTIRLSWSDVHDRETSLSILVVAKIVYTLSKQVACMVLAFIKGLKEKNGMRETLQIVITTIHEDDSEAITTHILKRDREAAVMITLLFFAYLCAQEIIDIGDVDPKECSLAWDASKVHATQFRTILINLLQHWLQHDPDTAIDSHHQLGSSELTDDDIGFDTGLDTTDIDAEEQPVMTQSRGRRRPKGAKNKRRDEFPLDVQRSGKKRMAEQSRLKAALTYKLRGIMSSTGRTLVPINFKEPIVYVDENIAPRLRPHQIDGIQFMWRELVEDPKHQGGLLAHTMGLGKTMQVISVLATIAQCNSSANPKIAAHIPQHLRDLRVLVLCPPTLIANWYEELILWLPKHDTLGPIYRVGNTTNKPYHDIKQWSETGGILLLAYGRLVSFCKTTAHRSGTTEEQRNEMSDWLLNLPKVVIADEAHMLRNPASQTSVCANKIITHSRLALTGSPLSNHLEEYWAMIDFIAPKYLGDRGSFQHKFVKPIELSLKAESSAYERRVGLKKLHVLKQILAPKVHRADITALHNDLPSKTEFYITVPLTQLQKEAYTLYVRHFRHVASQEQNAKANILVWIAMLSLLINHPFCFVGKLEDEAAVEPQLNTQDIETIGLLAGKTQVAKGDEDDAGLAEDVDISEDSAILSVAEKAIRIFHAHKVVLGMDDPALSYRCLMVKHLIEQVSSLGEKTLIFSHSIPTLNYLALMLDKMQCKYDRIDGGTRTSTRQSIAADFNTGDSSAMVFLISTRAGGLGLNLQGATRVIVFDYGWNPSWEEQAIGRAYRMGQKKPVFVYRFRAGGTYEDITFNSAVFKTQLFSRVVDHKSILRKGTKKANAEKYLFDPKDPDQKDFSECVGKDVVLDRVLKEVDCVRSIELTETFTQDIEETLTPQEELEANQELESEKLQLMNPAEYNRQQQRLVYSVVQASMATQAPVAQKQPRSTAGYNVINNALQQDPIPLLVEAAQQGTIPDLPSRPPVRWVPVNGTRSSYGDDVRPIQTPVARPPMNLSRPQAGLRADITRKNDTNGGLATADEDLQKLREHSAPGCQSQ